MYAYHFPQHIYSQEELLRSHLDFGQLSLRKNCNIPLTTRFVFSGIYKVAHSFPPATFIFPLRHTYPELRSIWAPYVVISAFSKSSLRRRCCCCKPTAHCNKSRDL